MAIHVGIQIEPQFGFSYDQIGRIAKRAEASGFHSLWCSDHFFLNDKSEARNCLECWTVLSALARDTETLRLGPLVSCVSYRYPSLLAKIAASVDHLSGGRLEFGLGAGWKEPEYEAYGIPFPPAGERVSQLDEALHVVKAMWTRARADFAGEHFQIKDAFCAPKPTQKPRPPIWVGGGKPRVLEIMARHADGVNFIPFPTAQGYASTLKELERACNRLGRDPRELTKSHFTQMIVAGDESALEQTLKGFADKAGQSVDEFRAKRPQVFIGTPPEVVKQMTAFVDLGVTQFMLMFPFEHELDMLQLVAERVLPQFG